MINDKMSFDESECLLNSFGDEGPNEGTSINSESMPLQPSISAFPLRETVEIEEPEIRLQRKIGRRIVITIAFLASTLVVVAIALGFIFLPGTSSLKSIIIRTKVFEQR